MRWLLALALALFVTAAHADANIPPCGMSSTTPCYSTQASSPSTWENPKWYYLFQGATYVTSTNSINIAAGHYATILFCNTSSTKSVIIFRRRFDDNVPAGASPLLYGGISGATSTSLSSTAAAISDSGPTATASLGNLLNTSAASTSVSVTFGAGTATVNGTINATGYLPTPGSYELQEPRGLGPGTCQAQFVRNPSATTAYNAVLTIYWWEQ